MAVLASINPGSISVPNGDSFGLDSVRQKVIDVSAEDTMTNWALTGWSSASDARVYFQKAHCPTDFGMWQHHRLKWTNNANLRIFYWDESKTKRMSVNLSRSSCYGASIDGGSGNTINFTAIPLNTWVDVDVQIVKTDGWRLFVDGTQVASGEFAWPADCDIYSCTFAMPNDLQMTEAVISETDTRGWRIQSEVPVSLINDGFNGTVANLQTLAPTSDSISSTGIDSTSKLTYGSVPTDQNIAAVSFSLIADITGSTQSPFLAQILEENGKRHFLGFMEVTADLEDSPVTFVTESNELISDSWTPVLINASTFSIENVHYQTFSSEAIGGGYGLLTGGPDWIGGTTMQIKADVGARTLTVSNVADDTVKYGTADRIALRFWLDDDSNSFEGVLTWNGNGYQAALDDTNYNMVVSSGVNMAMTFVAL